MKSSVFNSAVPLQEWFIRHSTKLFNQRLNAEESPLVNCVLCFCCRGQNVKTLIHECGCSGWWVQASIVSELEALKAALCWRPSAPAWVKKQRTITGAYGDAFFCRDSVICPDRRGSSYLGCQSNTGSLVPHQTWNILWRIDHRSLVLVAAGLSLKET